MSNNLNLPTVRLIGDSLENFYQLGVKDNLAFTDLLKTYQSLMGMNHLPIYGFYKGFELKNIKKIVEGKTELNSQLAAYTEGLAAKEHDVLFTLLAPELLSSHSHYFPKISKVLFGCSSLFAFDEKTESIFHGRVLDLPLRSVFERHERITHYQFSKSNQMVSFGTAGIPFACLTAMNDKNLTVALHYKPSSYFNPEGYPIFYIVHKLMSECDSIKSALKLLRTMPSLTYWGLYLSSSTENKVCAIDLCGDRLDKEEFDLSEQKFLYFTNRPIRDDSFNQNISPYNLKSFCQLKEQNINQKLKKIKKISSHYDVIDLLSKIESTPDSTVFKQGPITLNSVQVVSMNGKLKTAGISLGEIPRFNQGKIVEYDFFKSKLSTPILKKGNDQVLDTKYLEGMKRFSKAFSHFDLNEIQEAYHEIQMSIAYLESYPEKIIAHFYYLILRYKYTEDDHDFGYLLEEFHNLKGKLPGGLEIHRKLFVFRIEKLLATSQTIFQGDFTATPLIKFFDFENKLNFLALKLLRKFIQPRPEILDVLYLY